MSHAQILKRLMQCMALGHSFKEKYIKNDQMISSNLKILFFNALKIQFQYM